MSNQCWGNCGDITLNNGRKAGNLVRVSINSLNWGFPPEFYRVVSRRWRLLSFKLSICVDLLSRDYTDHSGGPVSRMGQFNVEQVRCRCWSCQHSPLLRSSTESRNRKTFTILISSILTRNLQPGKYSCKGHFVDWYLRWYLACDDHGDPSCEGGDSGWSWSSLISSLGGHHQSSNESPTLYRSPEYEPPLSWILQTLHHKILLFCDDNLRTESELGPGRPVK